jgi:hypothetical protein
MNCWTSKIGSDLKVSHHLVIFPSDCVPESFASQMALRGRSWRANSPEPLNPLTTTPVIFHLIRLEFNFSACLIS